MKIIEKNKCPFCEKIIIGKSGYINGGKELIVITTDNVKNSFSACEDCVKNISPAQLDELLERQKMMWLIEIEKQLKWFYTIALNLKVKHNGI